MVIQKFLAKTEWFLFGCLIFLFFNLIAQGQVFQLWKLHNQGIMLHAKMNSLKERSAQLNIEIENYKDPQFIEKQARERLDLVADGDLVFVFPSDQ